MNRTYAGKELEKNKQKAYDREQRIGSVRAAAEEKRALWEAKFPDMKASAEGLSESQRSNSSKKGKKSKK